MREIILVLQVPEEGEDGYVEHDPQDGDTLLEVSTLVRRDTTTYYQVFRQSSAAILTVDRLVDYVGRVMARIAAQDDAGE